jgi:hypothetical protein
VDLYVLGKQPELLVHALGLLPGGMIDLCLLRFQLLYLSLCVALRQDQKTKKQNKAEIKNY